MAAAAATEDERGQMKYQYLHWDTVSGWRVDKSADLVSCTGPGIVACKANGAPARAVFTHTPTFTRYGLCAHCATLDATMRVALGYDAPDALHKGVATANRLLVLMHAYPRPWNAISMEVKLVLPWSSMGLAGGAEFDEIHDVVLRNLPRGTSMTKHASGTVADGIVLSFRAS
jgi:hypothetical protein